MLTTRRPLPAGHLDLARGSLCVQTRLRVSNYFACCSMHDSTGMMMVSWFPNHHHCSPGFDSTLIIVFVLALVQATLIRLQARDEWQCSILTMLRT